MSIGANTAPPDFLWESDSTYTEVIGPSNLRTAIVSARESQANHIVTITVDQGSTITNVHSNTKCLDVVGAAIDDNANVQQFERHGGPNQRWYPRLINVGPRMAGSPPFPPAIPGPATQLFWMFAFHAEHSGSCLDVEDAEGSHNVQQFSPHFGRNQLWFILRATQPSEFYIVSAWKGWALDVAGESTADGGNVQVYPFNGNSNQRWRISPPPLIDSTATNDDAIWNLIRS